MEKTVIGLIETVQLKAKKAKKLKAKIDTGATISSIDESLAKSLGVGPIIRKKKVKSAHGLSIRPIVECRVTIAKKTMDAEFTIADRSHMKYSVLIGKNILVEGFLIDPQK